jgi:hypothetical protein
MPVLSAGFLVIMAAAFATNPPTAAMVGLLSPLTPGLWRGPLRGTFNGAQASLYSGTASATFLVIQDSLGRSAGGLIAAAGAAAIVAVVLNTGLVAGVMAVERGRAFAGVLKDLAWPTVASLPFALVALLVSILYREAGPVAAVFILSPLLVFRRARQGKVELEASEERTLRAFVRAVELKDPYTSRHSERVAAITVEIHRALGAREDFLQRRYYGALLHDIGKVGVSGRILTKPGRLTSNEYEIIQRHPGTGAFVVGAVGFLRDLVPEVLHHHERIDGRGYPTGLSDREIPLEARILAVADTFEALTSDRPYRPALSHLAALHEIQRCSETQLDPIIVAAFAQLLSSGQIFPALPLRSVEAPEVPQVAIAREA